MSAVTARDVCRALHWQHAPKWAALFEITARPEGLPPHGAWRNPEWRERRIDMLALRPTRPRYAGDGFERLAVEVKVSRSDFLADVRDPVKQDLWRSLSHAFAYAAPAGLIRVDELPLGAGLIELRSGCGGSTSWTKRATWKPGPIGPLPQQVLNTITHRMCRAEAVARGLTGRDTQLDEAELRAEVERLRNEVEKASNEAFRERELRQQWQRRYAAVGEPPCGTCGQPLLIRRGRRHMGDEWVHRPEHADRCLELRTAAAEPGRYSTYVSPPFPVDRLDGAA